MYVPVRVSQTAVIDLLEEICHIFPSSIRDQCQTIIGEFSKSVMDAVLSYATPEAICSLIQLCSWQEPAVVGQCAAASFTMDLSLLWIDLLISQAVKYDQTENKLIIIKMSLPPPLPLSDPCTLATYRCRDMQTALRCGVSKQS